MPTRVGKPPIADRRIRIAVVGCGRISDSHFAAVEKHAERLELTAVCDGDPEALRRAVDRTRVRGFADLGELLSAGVADVVVLCTPSGLHPAQTIEAARRVARHDRKADGNALERRTADGARMRHGRRAALRRQAESAQRDAAAAQARDRQGPLRPHLHGDHQRVLGASAVLLRQRPVARHVGIRRWCAHESGEPLRRSRSTGSSARSKASRRTSATLARNIQVEDTGVSRGALALRCARLDQRHDADVSEEPRGLDHHHRRERAPYASAVSR